MTPDDQSNLWDAGDDEFKGIGIGQAKPEPLITHNVGNAGLNNGVETLQEVVLEFGDPVQVEILRMREIGGIAVFTSPVRFDLIHVCPNDDHRAHDHLCHEFHICNFRQE